MSLYIASLNSGSNGNCYYIGTANESILVDAGLSCRETEKRMQQLGLSMQSVKGILISHEHTDHVKGLKGLAEKFSLPVYITTGTLKRSSIVLNPQLINYFDSNANIEIAPFSISSFLKPHDAAEPHSFVVHHQGTNIGVFTDIGAPCAQLTHHFKYCHAAFLEANYDVQMLEQGAYPYHLKKRIRGGEGHLSNEEALQLFKQYQPAQLSHLLLSHLSKDNNDPGLLLNLFQPYARHTHISIASRYQASPVYQITPTIGSSKPVVLKKASRKMANTAQLQLFA